MDNKLKILNFLAKNSGRAFTLRELSVALNIPYATFHRKIKGMGHLIRVDTIGRAKIPILNLSNPNLVPYLAVSSIEERDEFLRKQPVIRAISGQIPDNATAILFGSYAKGKETKKSDIDLMIFDDSGKTGLSFRESELLFGKHINPIVFTKKEFRAMIWDTKENVGKQAISSHILLSGPIPFWEMVVDGLRSRALRGGV